ncbi:hypothetical protein AGIG_G4337 [Arapaima gigas]
MKHALADGRVLVPHYIFLLLISKFCMTIYVKIPRPQKQQTRGLSRVREKDCTGVRSNEGNKDNEIISATQRRGVTAKKSFTVHQEASVA